MTHIVTEGGKMVLTLSQWKALNWLKANPGMHANWLISGVTCNTLNALHRRGLVVRAGKGPGSWHYGYKEQG